MVYFTCNSCGEAVQKPRVVKHISYECKKKHLGVSLCCVDCLENFNAHTYAEHTKCFTELERYSGSNFVMKASSNKGEKKQGSWINTVRSVLNQSTLTQQQRKFLEAISHFENVPRKKQKFQNFVKSSVRSVRVFPDVVDSVFDLLDKEFKNSAAATRAPESNGSVEAAKDSKNGGDLKDDNVENNQNEKSRDSKLDVAVSKEEKGDDVMSKECDESSINGEQILPKKKKKKRAIETQDDPESEGTSLVDSEQISPKKKKKKKAIETQDDPESEGQVIKKKKITEENDSIVLENGGLVPDQDGEISRKKKKTDEEQTSQQSENNVGSESISEMCVDHEKSTDEPETCVKFNWTDVVTSILSKSSSGQLLMKKLEKKVVKKYHNFYGDEKTFEVIVKRFQKRIQKMTNIEVDGEIIRLRES